MRIPVLLASLFAVIAHAALRSSDHRAGVLLQRSKVHVRGKICRVGGDADESALPICTNVHSVVGTTRQNGVEIRNGMAGKVPLPFTPASMTPYNLIPLPGTLFLENLSATARTSISFVEYLKAGDMLRIVSHPTQLELIPEETYGDKDKEFPVYIVKAVAADYITLGSGYLGETSTTLLAYQVVPDADDFISRLRDETEQRRRDRLAQLMITKPTEPTTAATTTTTSLALTTTATTVDASHCPGISLTGNLTVNMGSKIVTTSVDLRPEIAEGETIRINGHDFVVTEPRDEITLTLSDKYPAEAASGLTGCKVLDSNFTGVTLVQLSGCVDVLHGSPIIRTSDDLSGEIANGETMHIRYFEAAVTDPRDSIALTLTSSYTGESEKCVPAFLRKGTWDDGLIPLSGTITVTNNEFVAYTTADLRSEIDETDIIRIDRYEFKVTTPFTSSQFVLSNKYPGPSESGKKAFKLASLVPLSGYLSVVEGSDTATSTEDLRGEITSGDTIKILEEQFEVQEPQDLVTLTLSVPYPHKSQTKLKAFRVNGSLTLLSGLFTVEKGSVTVRSTADVRSEISIGDTIKLAGVRGVVTDPMGPGMLTLTAPFRGKSETNVPGYKVGRSNQQRTLESLALEKLKCKTIYCLAKIEQEEKGLPYEFPRHLAGGVEALENDLGGGANDAPVASFRTAAPVGAAVRSVKEWDGNDAAVPDVLKATSNGDAFDEWLAEKKAGVPRAF